MLDYIDFGEKEWGDWLQQEKEERYHAAQITRWLYQKGVLNWNEMSNLSRELREKLAAHFRLNSLENIEAIASADSNTVKFLFHTFDKHVIEAQLVCYDHKRIASLSTQIGTLTGAQLFALQQSPFIRNLRPSEIVEQALLINKQLAAKGEKVTHISFSGTGEPLKNYPSLLKSIHRLNDPSCTNISQTNINVSTIGVPEGIKQLTQEGVKINLTIGLHAPNQHLRKQMVPYAKKYPLEEILAAAEHYAGKVNRQVIHEYTLISGVNDHPDHAWELGRLLKGKNCQLLLIPYHSCENSKWNAPDKKVIKQFRSVLYGCEISNTLKDY
jgi:23S rRNA (adenine2503-C2)-methyltransferase